MHDAVYDLGNADATQATGPIRPAAPARGRGKKPQSRPQSTAARDSWSIPRRDGASLRRPFDWSASLSLLTPGLGQLLRGRLESGLFFLSSTGLIASFSWAIWNCRDRLAVNLPFLGLSRAWGLRLLLMSFAALSVLHIAAVISAMQRESGRRPAAGLLAVASFITPGWGQALAGRRWRAALCLGGLWLVGFAWLLASPAVKLLLTEQHLMLPAWLAAATSPLALYTAPAVLWAVAMSDAFHGRDIDQV